MEKAIQGSLGVASAFQLTEDMNALISRAGKYCSIGKYLQSF